MLVEALNFAATWPLTLPAHRTFVRKSVNLWSRANRCRDTWREHEAACHAAVSETVADMHDRRTAVVLGSGLLRDVPVEMLARQFDSVVLVDLVHLASVRLWLKARGFRNVTLIERDVSGYDDLLAGRAPDPFGFLRQVPYLDFVVSANLLSQIGLAVRRRIDGQPAGRLPADALQQVIRAHIDGLKALPCRTSLLTDIAFSVIDRTGHVHETTDLLHGVAVPDHRSRWQWPVVPFGEESRDYRIVHEVIAV